MENFATHTGTTNFKNRFSDLSDGHFRRVLGLELSSIGIGTYLGNWDTETDRNYTDSIVKFVELGGNVIDTASNYRFQRSERNIGKALEKLRADSFSREELFICTKGGYLPFDNEPPANVRSYFEDTFVKTGIADFTDLVGGSHCMTPAYLQSQIDQSLANMNIEAIDLFYIHNPESQAGELDKISFEMRLAAAFRKLEENRASGKIKYYGVATWNGFRVAPDKAGYHSLEKMVNFAVQVGGADHGFKFIQLPFNLAMPEALLYTNQALNGQAVSTIEAAKQLDVSVMISGSIMQGKLASDLPANISEALGDLETDAQTGIQFVRSTPGVTSALVGMSNPLHVAENMELAKIEPVSPEQYGELFKVE